MLQPVLYGLAVEHWPARPHSFVRFTGTGVAPGVSYTDHRPLIHHASAHTIRLELTFMAR
jgi:hypothetical protein